MVGQLGSLCGQLVSLTHLQADVLLLTEMDAGEPSAVITVYIMSAKC